jgi:hypothetical protein
MALDTYTTLQASIADWLNRSDLTAVIPDFVRLAEARIRREAQVKDVTREAITLSASPTTLPTTVKHLRSIYLNAGTGKKYPLVIMSPERLQTVADQYPASGTPLYAAVLDTELLLVPAPDTSYAAQIVYEQEWVPLASNPTNWLLTNHPDLYLYGALAEAGPYLKNDERVPIWDARFQSVLEGLLIARDRAEYPNTPTAFPVRGYIP